MIVPARFTTALRHKLSGAATQVASTLLHRNLATTSHNHDGSSHTHNKHTSHHKSPGTPTVPSTSGSASSGTSAESNSSDYIVDIKGNNVGTILASTVPVVIDAWADWYAQC